MTDQTPQIWWVRRDLRLSDNRALVAAAEAGPVLPLVIWDEAVEALGAAAQWRFVEGVAALARDLEARGSRLILRKGGALEVLQAVIAEAGAGAVHWQRLYDPQSIARDKKIKSTLKDAEIIAESHAGHLLNEPWHVSTGTGGYYKVYTPFWKSIRGNDPGAALGVPKGLKAPEAWPEGERVEAWQARASFPRGPEILARHTAPGEAAAQERLAAFIGEGLADYGEGRNDLEGDGTSRLSDYLSLGEISPRQVWQAVARHREEGVAGAEAFLRQIAWRDFAQHLMYHTPGLLSENWRDGWGRFAWITDADHPHLLAWQQGRTGIALVDAAMREMYVTGRMHNRARMVAASYLTKHLMIHWKLGMKWFDDCLCDWDPACNAMGWQWVAGTGPDASPFFRVFNPDGQAEKFDSKGRYRARWLAEGQQNPDARAMAFYDAIPRRWGLSPKDARPEPIVGLREGRERALEAYSALKSG
ncbi:DNA photolyase family protein [Rhodobacteraceae bacterium D3-12]|nr:DNA photolyase family protein [Rhodobacteraceae bacterium D3-12]